MARGEGRLQGTRMVKGRLSPRAVFPVVLLLAGFFVPPSVAVAQETGASPLEGTVSPPRPAHSGLFGALAGEAKLYLDDASALVTAPLSWNAGDRARAAGVLVLVGGLMVFDHRIAAESQERRSSLTNSISRARRDWGRRMPST